MDLVQDFRCFAFAFGCPQLPAINRMGSKSWVGLSRTGAGEGMVGVKSFFPLAVSLSLSAASAASKTHILSMISVLQNAFK